MRADRRCLMGTAKRNAETGARNRSAFTLLELIIALVVSGIVILGARALFEVMSAHTARVSGLTMEADARANGEHVLRSLIGRAEVGTPGAADFVGNAHEARFTSWCDVAGGWLERCSVALVVDHRGDSTFVNVTLSTGERIVVRSRPSTDWLRYLSDAADGGTWRAEWSKGPVAPLAIGVVSTRDTTIIRIGVRG
jgi:prepilin-type N-terminal cleavage/methylation domain-containing protein